MKKILALLACLCAIPSYSQNITVDLKEAPIRSTIEMMFKQAGIKNYVIDNSVSGFVTCTLTDLPFENSLKIVMRASTVPLTYIKENDVWIVKPRRIKIEANPDPEYDAGLLMAQKNNSISWEVIKFNHIDPFDLQSIFGNILFINQFGRYRGSGNNFGSGGRN
jgi:type II secretory pathway component HofQ